MNTHPPIPLPHPSARAPSKASTASPCMCWKPALRPKAGLACCCCTVSRNWPSAGARSCRRSRRPAITCLRRISAAMAAPPAGTRDFDGDLAPFRLTNLVRDALGVVSAFGHRSVAAVVGHDFGSSVAAWCGVIRPDVFRSVVLMSAPFAGPPQIALNTADAPCRRSAKTRCTTSSPHCHARASIITGIIRHAKRTPTCGARRRACMISCAPITITKARTGKTTGLIRSNPGRRANSPNCRPIM